MFQKYSAHIKINILLFFVFCFVQGIFVANASSDPVTYLAKGKSALEQGDYKVGVQFLARAVEESALYEKKSEYRAKTLEVMQTITTDMFNKEDLASDHSSIQAIQAGILTIVDSALGYDYYKDSEMLYNQKGSVSRRKGNIEQAMDEYNNALKINPKYSPSIFNLAVCYFKLKEYKKAYEELEKIPESDPSFGKTSKEKRDFLMKNFGQYIIK